jgi:anti-anti-sigma factor
VATHVVDGLELNVDRGPNWLFVKLRTKDDPQNDVPQIADKLWSISSRHFIYRLVLELDDLEELPSGMMGQLVLLQERLAQCGGALRICGLSPECEETLQSCHLDSALPNHATREEAVMGSSEIAAAHRN